MTNKDVTWGVEKISPAIAEKLLEKNYEENRPLNKAVIRKLARQMEHGQFIGTNGEDILISKKGNLLDGQHRLHAVIRSEQTIMMGVKRGLPETREVFESIDGGLSRIPADYIGGTGAFSRGYSFEIQAGLRLLWQYENGDLSGNKQGIGLPEVLEMHRKNPEIADAVQTHYRMVRSYGSIIPVSWTAFFLTVFARKDKKLAETFIVRLHTGEELTKKHPVKKLRDKLLADRQSATKLGRSPKLKLVMQAWILTRQKKWGEKLLIPDKFPKII